MGAPAAVCTPGPASSEHMPGCAPAITQPYSPVSYAARHIHLARKRHEPQPRWICRSPA